MGESDPLLSAIGLTASLCSSRSSWHGFSLITVPNVQVQLPYDAHESDVIFGVRIPLSLIHLQYTEVSEVILVGYPFRSNIVNEN